MKKFFALLLVCLMMLSLAACGNKKTDESEPQESQGETGETNNSQESTAESEAASETIDTREWYEMVDNDWDEYFVDLDTGIKMCYLTMGPEDGTPLLLIHGATDSRLSWAQVAPILADQGYKVYIPELRGHGKTDKPEEDDEAYTVQEHTADIVNFMDKVGLNKVNITGHSLGSLIAQEIAISYPERAASITLIASGAKSCDNEALTWCYYGDGTDYLGVHGYDEEQTMPEDFVRDWTACTNEDVDFDEGIYKHAAQLPYYAWAHIFGGLLTYDNRDRLDAITCPVQIIWGSEDVIFLEADQEELQSGLTNAANVKFVKIEGASHNTHWDSKANADQVSGLISDFAVTE